MIILKLHYLLRFLAGVILRERLPAFELMLWRACRGNVFLRRADIETPLEDPTTVCTLILSLLKFEYLNYHFKYFILG